MNYKASDLTSAMILILIASFQSASAQLQGADLLKTDILCVLAHPDDETGMASTIAYYAHGREATIANVYCTRGEGGGNMVGRHWGPSLGVLREAELDQCLDTLGVKRHYFLDQVDWAYTESAAMTLEKWDTEAALGELVRLIRNLQPEVILTMNPFPRAGQHGHHQAAGMLAVEAFTAAADPLRFPLQLKREGIEPWQTRKLYFRGESVGQVAKIDAGIPLPDGRNAHAIAGEALRNHRSQGFGRFQRTTVGRPPETFGLIKQAVTTAPQESDLLAGLPLTDEHVATEFPPPPIESRAIEIAFRPRPALRNFRKWADEQGITHLIADIPADLTVIAGRGTEILVDIANKENAGRMLHVLLEKDLPDGWTLTPTERVVSLKPLESKAVPFTVSAPANRLGNAELILTSSLKTETTIKAQLHLVPQASIGDTLSITPEQRVQGKADDANDISARVETQATDKALHVTVQVKDDHLVTNIASNDIRGHWRSDSVEVCIDPLGNSEHTLTCFKVGIFPFDLDGQPRAARDADANQGPIEETAPGMSIATERKEGGYTIRASIPWKLLGFDSRPAGQEMGFNVILYDGDKQDAAVGEDINECRLAWAPRRGVQGRPEDWGRLSISE